MIPFPREMSDKLTREMIFVWELDTGVIFNPVSGFPLLAFILENKRAVGIMKNKAHRDFVKEQLIEAVKTLNLAPDTRPPKPPELATWEGAKSRIHTTTPAPQVVLPGFGLSDGPASSKAGSAASCLHPPLVRTHRQQGRRRQGQGRHHQRQ